MHELNPVRVPLAYLLKLARLFALVILMPSMNTEMWFHPVVQRNLGWIEQMQRYSLVAPVEKHLACGDVGVGGLAEPEVILSALVTAAD